MNCKPNRLCIVIKSYAGNEGKIVKTLRFLGKVPGYAGENRWELDGRMRTSLGEWVNHHHDECLRMLPDLDEPESTETTLLAPLPLKETTDA